MNPHGCLLALNVRGHASSRGGVAGESVICAAVTGIVRACSQALADHPSIQTSGSAGAPGELRVTVLDTPVSEREWLRGVTDVILTGIGRIATDRPDEVELTIEQTGEDHGS